MRVKQTYRKFEGFRYRDVLRLAWRTHTAGQLFSGMAAHLSYQVSNLGRDYIHSAFLDWLQALPWFRDPTTRRRRNRFWLRVAGRGFRKLSHFLQILKSLTHTLLTRISFATWFAVYPLFYHANVQTIHLLEPTPLLPPLSSFIPFTSTSPISLPRITGPMFSFATVNSLLSQGASSYFLHSFIMQSFFSSLQFFLFKRILKLLPSPSNPITPLQVLDNENLHRNTNGVGDLGDTVDTGLTDDITHESILATAIVIADTSASSRAAYTATISVDHTTSELISPLLNREHDSLEIEAGIDERAEAHAEIHSYDDNDSGSDDSDVIEPYPFGRRSHSPSRRRPRPTPAPPSTPSQQHRQRSLLAPSTLSQPPSATPRQTGPPRALVPPSSPSQRPSTPLQQQQQQYPGSILGPSTPSQQRRSDPTAVPVSTSSQQRRSSTTNINSTDSAAAAANTTNRQQCRETALSSHPVDVVASHFADCIANTITLALESAVLRILARDLLLARGHGSSSIAAAIYPPFEIIGPGQLLIVRAMVIGEWSLLWLLFEVAWSVSTVIGVRWFGYSL
jgi:hypothetical protein